ncbi:transcription factor atf21 [Fusarium pseudoanthophilum]|uniref:Transcription factor atf21 n=1 Tax=Fusarium pseudoanthophilum TaxID=48495 RepID=A0A8H5US67_9HYPO|nr:transcription factor atf21 [Fusarium pseudoanthophilum]
MDGPSQDFGDQAQSFQNNFPLTNKDAIIDPLLDCTTGAQASPIVSNSMDNQLLMGSNMWNPMNNPVTFFPPSMPAMAPSAVNNSPKVPSEMHSTPETPSSEPTSGGPTRQSSKSSIPSVDSAKTDTKPRRSSRATKTQRQQPEVEPTTKRRQRRASKASSLKEEDEDEDGDDGLDETGKRSKFLKRNRIAASKCRQKKKVWMRELEETKENLETEYNALQSQYTELMGELTTIKNQLMDHASCNDANINQWLDNEARKYVQRIATQARQPPALLPQNVPLEPHNTHRRSSSGMSNLVQPDEFMTDHHLVATSRQRSIESEIIYDHAPVNFADARN